MYPLMSSSAALTSRIPLDLHPSARFVRVVIRDATLRVRAAGRSLRFYFRFLDIGFITCGCVFSWKHSVPSKIIVALVYHEKR